MATIEQTFTPSPVPPGSIDPNVIIPDRVKKAAAFAESFYPKEAPAPEAPAKDAIQQPVQPEPLHPVVADPAAPQADPKPVEVAPTASGEPQPQPVTDDADSQTWQHKFLSMQGRWRASQNTIGQMQEQMSQLGDELIRTQSAAEAAQQVPNRAEPSKPDVVHKKLITEEDRNAYGDELIDLARRVAMESMGPEIDALRNENQNLKQRVTTVAQKEVHGVLSRVIPNWVAINHSAEFKSWLRLRNVYTGTIRQQMLNDAYKAADAPKVLAFFQDFLREEVATGRMQPPTPQNEPLKEPTVAPAPAPRTAALSLDALAAPGRAKPASGESSVPADKPIITRAQISQFYADVRRQVYVGREAEKAQVERLIFDAQSNGRIR